MKLGNKKARLLKDLEITEVSLVTSPANEGAKVMFWKNDGIDFKKLNALSVEKLTAAMQSVDYAKIGTTPEELWSDYVDEVMQVHNTELSQLQKHPPDKLTDDEVKELRQKKPWTLSQATAAARKTNIGQSLWQLVQNCVREREANLLKHFDNMKNEVEDLKKRAQETIEIYDKIKRGNNNMETIEEVTQAALDGEFSDRLEAWAAVEKVLKNRVSKSTTGADFNQTLLMAMTQPSWDEFYEAYSMLPEARVELKKAEVRKVGTAEAEINRRAQEMLDKSLVKTFSKGVVRVTEIYPELAERYNRELYG